MEMEVILQVSQVGTLAANTEYTGQLQFLNESEAPSEDITEEIAEEDEDHQVFFEIGISDVTISYNDMDSMGNPIGLSTTVNTGNAGNGNLKITLRHEPVKDASGVSDGNIANAGGETDIEVEIDVNVQ